MIAVVRQLARRDRALVWLAAAGPPLAWVAHFAFVYWYAEGACNNDTAVGSVEPLVLVATALLGAVVVAAGIAGVSVLRRTRRGELPDPRERMRFMVIAGLIASIVFGFAIVLEGIQVLALPACSPG